MDPYVSLLVGVVCAGVGGELFVRGTVGLAVWARVSAGIIGATVAAFATSSPELSVAISSALAGKPEISLGDVTGSNVVNVALILALALCLSPTRVPPGSLGRDFPVALAVPLVLGVLGLDGWISRVDGVILLVCFYAWLVAVLKAMKRERGAVVTAADTAETAEAGAALADLPPAPRLGSIVVQSLVGLAFLVGSGHFIVDGAKGIATAFGVPDFVIGATIVAVGTSMPELATTFMSKLRGHDDIGLGTVLGSNIFNAFFIVGVAALICPIRVADRTVALALGFGLVTTALTFPPASRVLGRARGVILLACYAAYVVCMLRQ
jgi:cation:H+ antiporter